MNAIKRGQLAPGRIQITETQTLKEKGLQTMGTLDHA